jgi:(1->4)-alpha-D-glucan 1-alpha-D-glucosylmutase
MAYAGKGAYLPLAIKGKYSNQVMAFARLYNSGWYLIAVSLHLAQINTNSATPVAIDWENTSVILPVDAPLKWQNIIGGKPVVYRNELPLSAIFKQLPMAVLKCVESPV